MSEVASKFRNQKVELFLYLPEGTIFKMDENVRDFDTSDNNFFNLHFSAKDYIYKVSSTNVKCLNCPENENEYNDVEVKTENINEIQGDTVKTVIVKVNGKEIIKTETKKI